jgi:hypothetical protein
LNGSVTHKKKCFVDNVKAESESVTNREKNLFDFFSVDHELQSASAIHGHLEERGGPHGDRGLPAAPGPGIILTNMIALKI